MKMDAANTGHPPRTPTRPARARAAALPFRALGRYAWPRTPVNRGVDKLRGRLRGLWTSKDSPAGIDKGRLEPVSAARLDRLAPAPAHAPVHAELDATLRDWIADPGSLVRRQTLVLPPCDREDLVGSWAAERGLQVFGTDRREAELDALDDADADPLVIPKLERRFLRTRDGLAGMRRLIDRIAAMERRTVIGCNSWAWQFLRKSCEIDLVFADPVTFRAYDRERLRAWLGALAHGPKSENGEVDGEGTVCFRAVQNGRDVFGNGDGETELSAYMTDLAKRSLGIPWVAWHVWRDSLRVEIAPEEERAGPFPQPGPAKEALAGDAPPDRRTLWVTDASAPSVPSRGDQNALLVLHALLIHGGLTQDQIGQTVPLVSYTNVLASLVGGGLIDRTDGLYRCVPAAYPAVRDALGNNGYPVDVL
ncbi:MAG: hypothetical protein AAF311_05420 [Pseudomonadota bacterium]